MYKEFIQLKIKKFNVYINSIYVLTIYQNPENNRAYFSLINAFISIKDIY